MSTPELVEHFFRHEYGRLVAVLSRRVGMQHLELVEDAVQSTLMKALETWTLNADGGQPENPSGWLFRVAQNSVIEELRRRTRRERTMPSSNAPAPTGHFALPKVSPRRARAPVRATRSTISSSRASVPLTSLRHPRPIEAR